MKKLTVLIFTSLAFLTCLFSQNYNNTLRSTMTFPGQQLANIAGYWQNGNEYALVGASQGLVIVDITDPDNPNQIGQYTGPNNRWKEIKTYKNFAYVTSEGGGGVQIFDLSNLPNPTVPNHYYTGTANAPKAMTNIHALHIDTTAGFLYCFGGNYSGASIHDLNVDPYNPTYVAQYQGGGYIHDGYADNDTLYACHIYAGRMEIVDMRNKSNPQLLGGVTTPNAFPHNAWLLPGNKHILTTDERSNSWLACYDISDPTDIFEVDRMQTTPGSGSIVHNTHVSGHYAISSWYRDGYNIVDAFRPNNLVQVGAYDTWPQGSGNGFSGCWGVYPFFPSGTIIASNINPAELFILTPDYKEACYVEGTVTDACTGLDISDATITINSQDPLFDTKSNNNGIFRTGQPTPGDFIVTVEKAGYVTQTFDVTLAPHDVITLDVQMQNPNNVVQLPAFEICPGESVSVCGNTYNSAGSFSAVCPNANGCDTTFMFSVQMPNMQAEILGATDLTCLNAPITLSTAPTSGFIEWYSSNQTSPIATGSSSVTINDGAVITMLVEGSGCLLLDTVTIQENTVAPMAQIQTGAIDCSLPSVLLTALTGNAQNTFEWIDPNGAIVSTNQSLPATYGGTFTLTVTDPMNGCTAQTSTNVTADIRFLDIWATGGNLDCVNGNTSVSVSSSVPNSTFLWSTGGMTQTILVNATGTYTVTVTAPNGCTKTTNATVTGTTNAPSVAVSYVGTLDCTGGAVNIKAESFLNGNYAWTGPNGYTATSDSITVNQAGDYTVVFTDANGCSASETVTLVGDYAPPVINTLNGGPLTCSTTLVDILATSSDPNVSFMWNTGQTGSGFAVSTGGNYTVTATGANGCTTSSTVTILEDIAEPDVITTDGTLTCAVNTVGITATSTTAGVSYLWSSGQNVETIFVNAAGTYTVTATATNGCTSEATSTVTQNITTPDLQIISGGDLSCTIQLVDVFAQSNTAVDYQWTSPTGMTSTLSGFGVSQPGTYCVTITDANGCTASDCITITSDTSIPQVTVTGGTITCTNPTVEVIADVTFNGSVSYEWGNGQTGANIFTNAPGSYSVTVTADNGCTSSGTAVVIQDTDIPVLDISGNGIITCANPFTDLTAQTNVGGSFSWVGPAGSISTQQTITVGDPGLYCVTFTDAQGCSAEECITVGVDAGIPDAAAIGGTLNCINSSVTIQGSSTTPNVSLEWMGPNGFTSTDASATVSTPGNYILTVTDLTNGCTTTATTTVDQDFSTPSFTVFGGGVLYCSGPVPLNIIPPTNNNTFEWIWPDGTTSTGDTLSAPLSGIYTIIGTNPSSGCTSSEDVIVTINTDIPVLTMSSPGLLDCCNPSTTLLLESNLSAVSYSWTGPGGFTSTEQQPTISMQGSYTVVVTSLNSGCTSSLMTTVASLFTIPDITATGGTITCTQPTVTLDAQVSNVSNPTFQWTGANGFNSMDQNPMVDMEGTYTVVVEDPAHCCTASEQVMVVDSCSVSIVDLEKEGNIKVYPNATSGLLNIESTIATTSIQSLAIFDASGKLVQQQNVDNQQFVQLDLSDKADGTYVLRLLADEVWWSVQVVLLK